MYLGKIDMKPPGKPGYVIRLNDRFMWECPDPWTMRVLRDLFPWKGSSPSEGKPGHKLLFDAAEHLKGQPTWLASEPADKPGVIY